MPEIQEQIHDYRCPAPTLLLPPCLLAPFLSPGVCVCVCAPHSLSSVEPWYTFVSLSVCLAQNKAHPGAGQPVKEELDRMQLILLQEPKEDELAEVLNTGCRMCSS